jgi:hypothetical protein
MVTPGGELRVALPPPSQVFSRDPTLIPRDPTLIRRDPTLIPAQPTPRVSTGQRDADSEQRVHAADDPTEGRAGKAAAHERTEVAGEHRLNEVYGKSKEHEGDAQHDDLNGHVPHPVDELGEKGE